MTSIVFRGNKSSFKTVEKAAKFLCWILAVAAISLPLLAQSSQGTIQGAVFDQTGGAIAGATLTVIDVARGVTRVFTTDAAGAYVDNDVTPGTYTVRAEAKGFRTVEHSDVLVEVGENVRVDLVVQPGEQTQTITVTGEVPAIDTTDATLGGAVNNQAILALPLNGRNFERLLELRPGVITAPGTGTGVSSTNGRRTGDDVITVEGIPQFTAKTNENGVMNMSYEAGDSDSLLPIDAIQEFNTEQNPKAEYGWRDGSIITVGVKSGTNSLHGTAYAFGRDASATDAANYFSTPAFPGATPATVEQFGATAGGPILKDKLFWFVGYEGLRYTVEGVTVDTIPSDVAGSGPTTSVVDACNALNPTHAPLGAAANKINPLSAQLTGLNPTTCVVSPASSTVENLFPYNPNASNSFAPGLITNGPPDNGIIKGDYIPGPHHHLSGMYYESKQTTVSGTGALLPQWEEHTSTSVLQYDGSWTWTPNSTWVNDVRLGTAYFYAATNPGDANTVLSNPWPSGYGITTGVTNPLGLPGISITGFTGSLGAANTRSIRGPEGDASLTDTVSYLRGKHAFKFGFNYVDMIVDGSDIDGAAGAVTFSTLENFLQGVPKSGSILVGNPAVNLRAHWYAGFAQDDWRVAPRVTLNLGLRYEFVGSPWERNNYLGNFAPNVNPATTPAVQQVGPGEPIPSLLNNYYKGFAPRLGVAWDVRGNGKTVVRAGAGVLRDVTPLGFVGSGAVPFGANFPTLGINTSGTTINAHTPDSFVLTPSTINWSIAGPIFAVSAPTVINGVTYTGVTCTPSSPCKAPVIDPNFHEPYAAEWNLDIQRAITNNLTVDVAYVGNHGFEEPYQADLNEPPIGAGWAGAAASNCLASAPLYNNCKVNTVAEVGQYSSTFPYFNHINQITNGDYSNYDGLQVTAVERVSHGLSFISGYTYSHALDMNSGSSGLQSTNLVVTLTDLHLLYGNSNNDIRNRFTFSPTYLIPGMKSPGQMLEGWSVSSIVILQGGEPWSPNDTTNDLAGIGEFSNDAVEPWNYSGPRSAFTAGPTPIPCFGTLPGCTPYPVVNGVPQPPAACMTAAQANGPLAVASLVNLGCYVQGAGVLTPAAYGTYGNASRNLFRGPHYYNVDFSVAKIWKLKERYSAQFRMEFFNLFNHADFISTPGAANPNSGFSGQFGCSCSTPDASNPVLGSGGPRHIQFGLKLTY